MTGLNPDGLGKSKYFTNSTHESINTDSASINSDTPAERSPSQLWMQTEEFTSVSGVDFTGLDSGTDYFILDIVDVRPDTPVDISFRVSTDGGATTETNTYDYDGIGSVGGTAITDSATAAVDFHLTRSNASTDEGAKIKLHIYNPANASRVTQFRADVVQIRDGGDQEVMTYSGSHTVAEAIDTITLRSIGGVNISGKASLYRVLE